MMKSCGVIPRPLPERLRDARRKLLPGLVFLCTLTMIALIWRAHFVPAQHVSAHGGGVTPEQGVAAVERTGKIAGEEEEDEALASVTGQGGPVRADAYTSQHPASRN